MRLRATEEEVEKGGIIKRIIETGGNARRKGRKKRQRWRIREYGEIYPKY